MKDSVKDKIVGCLYGQAVGDALGLGTEFMSKDEVKRNYPNGLSEYSQIVQDYHRKRWDKGDWTDDTDMMLCIAKAIIKSAAQKWILIFVSLFITNLKPLAAFANVFVKFCCLYLLIYTSQSFILHSHNKIIIFFCLVVKSQKVHYSMTY